ncbi:LLM class flavin-dependent oxidoreductase [Alkalihalobacillus pseudalcaliphilus]|uniref:LLM class flavin-dependent oxidoreductase n=1 Tax=Alkalihalobacillus pseudalcaliphilus TaxID=79884 RepID=UPI00064DE45D|nr:LLM class flavin-dependent oxidoreductase [Alkalihalobacillus pseudalcaliphilus]KMK76182.1 luciferase [Alkalihalobacillus pseudalcaliphilus]
MSSHKSLKDIRLSILDLVPISEGKSVSQAFEATVQLAKKAEELGFHRFWVAEHHNMPGIGSSATSVVIGHIANHTSKIRVGAGGIMLPNHSTLMIAEQFGTLEAMYPNRIDLGLGRAPGSDQATMRAVRRGLGTTGDEFPEQVEELRQYFEPERAPFPPLVRAYPGENQNVPIWLLGSSGFSAKLAAELGLPFAFASHFSPDFTLPALDIYRSQFQPSEILDEPYVMVGKNVIAANSLEEATYLATSQDQQFLSLIRGRPGRLQPPTNEEMRYHTIHEQAALEKRGDSTIIGDPSSVKEELELFLAETDADEIIINSTIYDEEARKKSLEIISEAAR